MVLSVNNQEEINRKLSADFSISIDDFPEFMERVLIEYENNIRLLLNNIESSFIEKDKYISELLKAKEWFLDQIKRKDDQINELDYEIKAMESSLVGRATNKIHKIFTFKKADKPKDTALGIKENHKPDELK